MLRECCDASNYAGTPLPSTPIDTPGAIAVFDGLLSLTDCVFDGYVYAYGYEDISVFAFRSVVEISASLLKNAVPRQAAVCAVNSSPDRCYCSCSDVALINVNESSLLITSSA